VIVSRGRRPMKEKSDVDQIGTNGAPHRRSIRLRNHLLRERRERLMAADFGTGMILEGQEGQRR